VNAIHLAYRDNLPIDLALLVCISAVAVVIMGEDTTIEQSQLRSATSIEISNFKNARPANNI